MTKKEHTTITELFQVLDLLESLDMQFWLDGGWGVDVLYGQQTRWAFHIRIRTPLGKNAQGR